MYVTVSTIFGTLFKLNLIFLLSFLPVRLNFCLEMVQAPLQRNILRPILLFCCPFTSARREREVACMFAHAEIFVSLSLSLPPSSSTSTAGEESVTQGRNQIKTPENNHCGGKVGDWGLLRGGALLDPMTLLSVTEREQRSWLLSDYLITQRSYAQSLGIFSRMPAKSLTGPKIEIRARVGCRKPLMILACRKIIPINQ